MARTARWAVLFLTTFDAGAAVQAALCQESSCTVMGEEEAELSMLVQLDRANMHLQQEPAKVKAASQKQEEPAKVNASQESDAEEPAKVNASQESDAEEPAKVNAANASQESDAEEPAKVNVSQESDAEEPAKVKAASQELEEPAKPAKVNASQESDAEEPVQVNASQESETEEPAKVNASQEPEEPAKVNASQASDAEEPVQVNASQESDAEEPVQVNASQESDAEAAQPIDGMLTLANFKLGEKGCYDRSSQNQWAVVDSHLHPRPFGGPPVPFTDLLGWMRRAGILFSTLYGIGQRLPVDSPCTYYLDCPGTNVTPSLKNDFFNAQAVLDNNDTLATDPSGPVLTLSMSHMDLDDPEHIMPKMQLLEQEFPNMFRWAGEINVVKQALWDNSAGLPIPKESIAKWAPFMEHFRKNKIPIGLHCDIGNMTQGTQFLELLDTILEKYPDNQIIWVHLGGLSKQIDPTVSLIQDPLLIPKHIEIIKERLNKYSKLSIDLSWDVLYTELYTNPKEESYYIKLLNEYPTRFISGSDHVAADTKTEDIYRSEVNKTSAIYKALSDDAFRNIALGENYFVLAGLNYTAPKICIKAGTAVKAAALQERQEEIRACSQISGSYTDNFGNIFDVVQNGCTVDFTYEGEAKSGKMSGSKLKVEGFNAEGEVQEDGTINFADGGTWKKEEVAEEDAVSLENDLTLADFTEGAQGCYDRATRSHLAVVDSHFHARPFGGPPVPFVDEIRRFRRAGILFAVLYGIGQRLPIDSPCTYYGDCPGTNVTTSLKNDFINGVNVLDYNESLMKHPAGPVLTLSMSHLDLSKPKEILPKMQLLEKEFPGMFTWVGELNIVKQALWNNSAGLAVTKEQIAEFAPFMKHLREQNMPVAFHSDIGNTVNGTEFLQLIDEVLRLYPDNKIIWVHMAGLSKQLDIKLKPSLLQQPLYIPEHVKIMKERLDKYPLLSIDLSWDVLYYQLYTDAKLERPYIDLLNEYPLRFLSGSDHVAAVAKTEEVYREEVARTSFIFRALNDAAFRNIVLGQNYFELAGLKYVAPKICVPSSD